MIINQENKITIFRAWSEGVKHKNKYVSFWDGYDYVYDFSNRESLIESIEEHYGPDWTKFVEIHEFEVTEKRVK